MATRDEEALKLHERHRGKLSVVSRVPLKDARDLAMAYTPGVAAPCLRIAADPEEAYRYTFKGRMVAVVTDGTAVLGLGNIGGLAGLPVMEGKCALLKKFGGIDAFPICLATQKPEEIIDTVVRVAPSFGAIMLEDIAAPQCVFIERELKQRLNIPVFHDDQHGTAIVVSAAILNVCRHLRKDLSSLHICVSGTGAAGSSICRMLRRLGVGEIRAFNKQGIVSRRKYAEYDFLIRELLDQGVITSFEDYREDTLRELIRGSDVFIGVSAPDLVDAPMIRSMAKDPVVFAMANPRPEILPEIALAAGARIVGTGRSDFPNQINNVLIFPGLFRGALKSRAKQISEEMKLASARGLAALVADDELADDYILPRAFDRRVAKAVADAVIRQAKIEQSKE